ncbi:ribosome-associated ATPase/putative transporter RbbA [Gallaecimonas kandeliae]|uniref:ribosome-associated ATPase/putative transporter RbbA n=1 Tax=Gallaecimonas kandeliae TaxID=3029055 RepID=UPI002649CEFA|nr:ribosome-associated ATPase/putative transporter RbbA [Gallaecimonas kandeliae]WKE64388.1 ribosome-associated ATPase/putative transporter RbbA [Gallaecimonas kandeliae]
MSAIRLEGVSHRYGDNLALDEASLRLAPGQSLGIIGPDGVGKSTLLDLIAGTKALQQGKVQVLGADMARRSQRRKVCADIAYMPQGLGKNLYPTLSVWENIDFFGRLFGQGRAERERRARQLLEATHLWAFRDRPAGKLSGGMKQKLGLCCALIHDPKLLLLDEPTTGVDPLSRRQFWTLVAKIREARPQMSLVVATAYMEEAMMLDQVMALDAGKVLALDSPQGLLARTGKADLEAAFVALKGGDGQPFQPLPLKDGGGEPAIVAEALTCRFGDFTAVDQVSLSIEKGEIFGFLGSNGCGKTTTMKMLTGLLPPTEGSATIFGEPVTEHSLAMRAKVGYMTQAFSLYGELTVRANLELHARLYAIAEPQARIAGLLARFGLDGAAEQGAEALPLGLKQRLQLAVAVLHGPRLLILDEPTSGVDPQARDQFWTLLHELSRQEGVTIFISTHFMNEAGRCDRISLMHAGQVLAQGKPEALVAESGAGDLEGAFIHYLEAAQPPQESGDLGGEVETEGRAVAPFSLKRLWAYARRESMEIKRDPIRLAFALLGTLLLMVVFGYGISFDVEHLPFAAFDQDQSPSSRAYLEEFRGSRYFQEQAPVASEQEAMARLRSGKLRLVLAIPPGFGRDLKAGRHPQVAAWLDGAMPFRGETARGYVLGVHQQFLADRQLAGPNPVDLELRFRYNQAFKSVNAMVPGVLMLLLAVIPAILTAVGVVREKELGSILNLYATPVTRLEFLLGKQLPYVLIACVNGLTMLLLALWLFQVPVKGSFLALGLGVLLYVTATTGFGLLISAFVRTQVAALFAAAILSILPAVNFSGFIVPLASMTGVAKWMGVLFPPAYFHTLSEGVFAKGLGLAELVPSLLALAAFAVLFVALAVSVMKEQES